MNHEVDVVVLGLGVGGEYVAEALAEAGLRVVGIEKKLVGGECPYWGCIPSKMIVRGADLLTEGRRIPELSGSSMVSPDYSPVALRIRKEATDYWADRVAVERFEKKGGTFVRGEGRFAGPDSVAVGDDVYRARRAVVIAIGSSPVIPPIQGINDVPYWTNREAIEAETLPKSMAVLGGGAIGAEIAQAWRRFGVEVTVIEGADRLVPAEEPESSKVLAEVFQKEGITLHLGVQARQLSMVGGEIRVGLSDGNEVVAEKVLLSVGRSAKLRSLNLEAAGLDGMARSVDVDAQLRAGDRIWAVGDCTGKGAFTHVAMYQGRIAVASILGKDVDDADYGALPRVTFTDPEIGSVGMTEKQARDAGIDVRVGRATVASSTRGWIHGPGNEGHIKLIEDTGNGILIGATSMGPWGGEVLALLALAVHAKVPTEQLRTMIYAYPTFHRGIEQAVKDLR